MKQLTIFKIGGKIIDDKLALEETIKKFCKIEDLKILVHGGGTLATQLAEKLGLQTKMLDGRRITDKETIKMVTMVYAGLINKEIVALLQKYGCNAIGLSGADGNIIPAHKRKPNPIDYGFVGDIDPYSIDELAISSMLARGLCPVFCPITHDQDGQLLNTNADTMASSIAIALATNYSTELFFDFDKKGVLYNANDPDSIIPLITSSSFEKLKEDNIISDGMIPKLQNAFYAINNGVKQVFINGTMIKK